MVTLITGELQGLSDVLFNRMTPTDVENLETGKSGGKPATVEGRVAEAKERVYRDEAGLYLPSWTLKRVLLDGCSGTKMKLSKSPLWRVVYASVFVDGPARFNATEPDYIHEVVGRIPPRTGKAAVIRRPALAAGWRLTFGLQLTEPIPPDMLRRGFEFAGLRVGVGAWRPEYGRFVVSRWDPDTA